MAKRRAGSKSIGSNPAEQGRRKRTKVKKMKPGAKKRRRDRFLVLAQRQKCHPLPSDVVLDEEELPE